MTLQVGFVGTDGIVLASDTLVNVFEAGNYSFSNRSKFFYNDGMICCWSGDSVARRTAAYYRDADWTDPAKRGMNLRECGVKAWKHEFGDVSTAMARQQIRRKVLIAFPGDCVLLEVELSSDPFVEQIKDRAITGSDRTTVKYLTNNYFPCDPQPVSRLVTLAAHVILMGHNEQPGDIGGLEIAIVQNGRKPEFLNELDCQRLTQRSLAMHATLADHLQQDFLFQPSGAG